MKKLTLYLMFVLALLWSCQSGDDSAEGQDETEMEETTSEAGEDSDEDATDNESLPSPRRNTTGTISDVSVTVDWGSPGVKGREIWGELEPYGQVWRAGANENTTIEFSEDVLIGGQPLEAGKYGFFIILKENEDWTVIFSERNDAWGAFEYKEEEDALRVDVTPQQNDELVERLKYEVNDNGITFSWEKVTFTIPVEKA